MLKLGVVRVDITPPEGVYLIGYGDRAGGNTSVRDRLTATAAVWSTADGSRTAVVFADLLGVNREVYERINKRVSLNVKLNGLLISCLHTHSGPVAWAPEHLNPCSLVKDLAMRAAALPAGLKQPRGVLANKRYIDSLVIKIADAVIQASSEVSEVEGFHGRTAFRAGVNRREKDSDGRIIIGRNIDGPAPETMKIIQFREKNSGAPLLNLINIDCHPVLFGPVNYAVSADWPGEMRRNIESELSGSCVVMQGGSGNVNPNELKHEAGITSGIQEGDLVRLGAEAAGSVIEACRNLEPVRGVPVIFSSERRVDIPVLEGRGYRKELAEAAGMPEWIVDPVLNLRYPWKTETKLINNQLTTPVYCSLINIGGLSIAGLSMETFFETAESVRAMLPEPVLFSGYTNGLTGYLPTAAAFDAGGYEVETSPYMYRLPGLLATNSEEIVKDSFRQMADEISKQLKNGSMRSSVTVRQIIPEDENAVANICHKTFASEPEFPYPDLVSYRWASWYVRNSYEYCFAAVDEDDRPVGYILCAPDSTAFDRGYVDEMEPLIKVKLRQLNQEYPEIYTRYHRTFLPPVREYGWPFMKPIVKEYPAHLHIDILPGYQKGGFGGRLMKALLNKLETDGIKGVHLIVGAENANAVGYYKHHGFEVLKTVKIRSINAMIMGRRM